MQVAWPGGDNLLRTAAHVFQQESFTQLPRDRFTQSTALEFYHPLDHLGALAEYVTQYTCAPSDVKCHSRMRSLEEAVLFDFSYDTNFDVVKLTVMWDHQPSPISASAQPGHRVEVGLLTTNEGPHIRNHEMGVAGLLTVLGQDKKPSPVMFAFPARHSQAGTRFSSSFHSPMGLHPTMQLNIGSSKAPKEGTDCSLHAYLTLPRTIFADKYQLEDELFLASKNLTTLRYISQPVDLEAPDYVMKPWGSSVLLELKPPAPGQDDEAFTAEIPLHLRYQAPEHGGQRPLEVPYPAVFWACSAEEDAGFSSSPFDRLKLGYDSLFGPRTLFWHLEPTPTPGSSHLMLGGQVPVLDLERSGSVAAVTAAVVLAGFAWVAWKLTVVYSKTECGAPPRADGGEKKKQ